MDTITLNPTQYLMLVIACYCAGWLSYWIADIVKKKLSKYFFVSPQWYELDWGALSISPSIQSEVRTSVYGFKGRPVGVCQRACELAGQICQVVFKLIFITDFFSLAHFIQFVKSIFLFFHIELFLVWNFYILLVLVF